MAIDRKAIFEKVVVGVITAVVLGALALFWNWGSNGGLIRVLGGVTLKEVPAAVGGVPSGAVVAFDLRDSCPTGWAPFDAANGRVILGAGRGDKLMERSFGQPGGAETHTLSVEELAPHGHAYADYGQKLGGSCLSPGQCKVKGGDSSRTTGSTGGLNGMAKPFDLMPPFIALRMCKKQ